MLEFIEINCNSEESELSVSSDKYKFEVKPCKDIHMYTANYIIIQLLSKHTMTTIHSCI